MGGHRRSGRNGSASVYCSRCGTGLEGSMNYCPNCGAPSQRAAPGSRSRTVDARAGTGPPPDTGPTDRERLERRIARASREGWKLEHDFGDRAVMVRRTFGSADEHLAVALVTLWFTMGLGNALWGVYRYVGDAERTVVRADSVESDGRADPAGTTPRWRRTAAGWWLAAALVAAVGLQIAGAATSLVAYGLAAAFATMGATAVPAVRRRLETRHPVTANGRVRSVDERTVVAPDRPCAACAAPVGRGIERTYRRAFCVLGVPLTATKGRNYYCRRCANAEATGAETSVRPDPANATGDREAASESNRTT